MEVCFLPLTALSVVLGLFLRNSISVKLRRVIFAIGLSALIVAASAARASFHGTSVIDRGWHRRTRVIGSDRPCVAIRNCSEMGQVMIEIFAPKPACERRDPEDRCERI